MYSFSGNDLPQRQGFGFVGTAHRRTSQFRLTEGDGLRPFSISLSGLLFIFVLWYNSRKGEKGRKVHLEDYTENSRCVPIMPHYRKV